MLFITVDTLRADRLGPYGFDRPISPALDRLAAEAVVFDEAQSSTSWTLPALATLMTSHPTSTHGAWDFESPLDESYTTLAEILASNGYDTAAVASHVFLGREFGLAQGFTHFDDDLVQQIELSHLAVTSDAVTERGVRFVERKAAARAAGVDDTPWFLWLHYFDPHHTYFAHTDFPFGDSEEDRYLSEIAFTDRAIGRVLDTLRATGSEADTIVVFTADHGEEFGDHGGLYHGLTLHREVVRVPLIVRVPGVAARREAAAVGIGDVLGTVLEVVGVEPRNELSGRSLVPALKGEPLDDAPVIAELRRTVDARFDALLVGPWKLIRDRGEAGTLELYERLVDPTETLDVAHRHPGTVLELAESLDALVQQAEVAGSGFGRQRRGVGADMAQALEALGYVDGVAPSPADGASGEPDGEPDGDLDGNGAGDGR
ncbi:sulfatase [Rohdeia mirabilis]|uniref:sulfatase n=1 Tax=Rohdeia mirabilis TaxID=2528008 RepID=UPI003AF3A170